ncbi:MAG: protocatechuate 3,4-dioxygenase [Xanthobacteraceae bacterium]
MSEDRVLKRRDVLRIAAAFGAMSAMSPVKVALAQSRLRRTPDQILGPFYPAMKTAELSGDLTQVPGRSGHAEGQVLNVMGRVLNIKGEPVPGVGLEVWQANTYGRYTHPADRNPAPLDPNFEGFAALKTDAEGHYKFKTVKPGAYPVGPFAPGVIRPPHIHFRLLGREDELVTQMYFEGDPLNEKDLWLHSVLPGSTDLLIARMLPPPADLEQSSLLVIFDIVTLRG